jgi:DHA1 family bicyclomycin/chloramphenicol resistance-like MFS transporter
MKEKLFVTFLIVISAIPPLSTDIYLPSLPAITTEFQVTDADTNATLIGFFLPYGFSTLVWGALSDKYGRRPILIVGSFLYFAGSLLCTLSGSLGALVASRTLQGLGGGSGMAASSAIVKDVYAGRRQEGILAAIQSMIMIGPVVAPVIGSALMDVFNWRGIFFALMAFGIIMFVGSLIFKETIRKKNNLGVFHTLGRLVALLRSGVFAAIVVLFALPGICVLAYVTASTYIYQEQFGLGYDAYSFFFGVSSIGAIIGPAIYMVVSKKRSRFGVVRSCVIALIAIGVFTFFFGEFSPWVFASSMFMIGLLCSIPRPGGAYLALNYYKGDTGAASSLMASFASFTGCIGMAIVTINPRYVLVVGIVSAVIGIASLIVWLGISRRYDVG